MTEEKMIRYLLIFCSMLIVAGCSTPLEKGVSATVPTAVNQVKSESAAFSQLNAADILIVVAHPDDEIYLNGTIRHLVASGHHVQILYTTSGKFGRHVQEPNIQPDVLGPLRIEESRKALLELGIVQDEDIHFLAQDTKGNDAESLISFMRPILEDVAPDILITFGEDGIYGHPDHRAASDATAFIFRRLSSAKALINVALSETKDKGYNFARGLAMDDSAINFTVNTLSYVESQTLSVKQYTSQFEPAAMSEIIRFYRERPYEEFVVSGLKPLYDKDGFNAVLDIFATPK